MPYVHDPKALISGGLNDNTASGTFNVYGQYGDTNSNKVNSASYGSPGYEYWGDVDANMLGHLFMDVVNSGTVPLFLSATSAAVSGASLAASASANSASIASTSGALASLSAAYRATSQSLGVWPGSGTYTGSLASDITGTGLSVSGVLMYTALRASQSLANTNLFSNQIAELQSTSSFLSDSLYGVITPWTGALPPGTWPTGVMGELVRVSGILNSSGTKWDAASSSLSAIVYPMSANLDVSSSAWNAVSSSFYSLSSTFAAVSAALSGVAFLTSANWTPSGGMSSITGTMTIAGAPASASHQLGNGVLNVYGVLDGIHLLVADTASANFLENWLGTTGSATLSAYWAANGDIFTSGNFVTTGTAHFSGGAFFGGSKVRNIAAATDPGDAVEYSQFTGSSGSNAAISAAFWPLSAAFYPLSQSLVGVAYLTSTDWEPSGGLSSITGSVIVYASGVSGSHDFGSGALSIDSAFDAVVGRTADPLGYVLAGWLTTSLNFYVDGAGNVNFSGAMATPGKVYASGGLDAGSQKITNVSAGTTTGDAVNYGQFQPVSSSLVQVSQSALSSSNDLLGMFSVRNYGAKGDQFTDDYPAFSATVSAAYAWAATQSGTTGATVLVPPGAYVISSTLDLTLGDPLGTSGSGGTSQGMGRIKFMGTGQGRYQSTLWLGMGSASDGIIVGGYTHMSNLSITSPGTTVSSRNAIVSRPNSGSAPFNGRSAERLKLERVFIRGACATSSILLPAGLFFEFDTVQALCGLSCPQGTASLGSRSSYDSLIMNSELTNTGNTAVPAVYYLGSGLTIIGGLIYTANPSTQPGLIGYSGTITCIGTDFDFTAVSSVSGYDVVASSGCLINLQSCLFPPRASSTGVLGNIYITAGSRGGSIGTNVWVGTPAIHIEAGAGPVAFNSPELVQSNISFMTGTSLAEYSGSIILRDVHNLDMKPGASSPSQYTMSINDILADDPVSAAQYTASYSGSKVQSEVWRTFGGNLIKSSSYSYNSASLLSQSFVSVYNSSGVTIIGQTTSSYFYSGSSLISATVSRSI